MENSLQWRLDSEPTGSMALALHCARVVPCPFSTTPFESVGFFIWIEGMVSVLTKEETEKLIDLAITRAVAAALDINPKLSKNRLAYSEPEAASILGVNPHVIRDARLRGEIRATRVGGRLAYTRDDLCSYLERGKQ
jgi:hypothetical protein